MLKRLVLLVSLAACGSVHQASSPDTPPAPDDARAAAPPQGAVVVAGAGHAAGGNWAADVQIHFASAGGPNP